MNAPPRAGPDASAPRTVSAGLAGVLLALCAFFAAGFTALGAYVYRTHARTRALQAELAQKGDLQQRLMADVPSDLCLYPHFKNSVGYVLNPFMKEGTLWGEGTPYAINPFGLRGPGIGPRVPGRHRIVLLGDSWFFGWRLKDDDKLQAHLQRLFGNVPWDVVTVALAGWNVRSEGSFLASHIRYLDPDVVIWEVCSNDTWDVGAVIPPGSMSSTISPQNPDPESNAFAAINPGLSLLPVTARRHRANLALLQDAHVRYGVPVLTAVIDIPPAEWAALAEGTPFDLPTVFMPAVFRQDPRAYFSVHDSHPTAWMNRLLALGYAARLVEMGVLPAEVLRGAEPGELAAWKAANTGPPARAEVDRALRATVAGLRADYATADDFQQVAAGVIDQDGRMGRRGLVHLRVPPDRRRVRLEFEAADYTARFARQVTLAVRDVEGRETSATQSFSSAAQRVACDLALPKGPSRLPAYEIEWSFNYDECDYPTRCFAGRLARITSRQ